MFTSQKQIIVYYTTFFPVCKETISPCYKKEQKRNFRKKPLTKKGRRDTIKKTKGGVLCFFPKK